MNTWKCLLAASLITVSTLRAEETPIHRNSIVVHPLMSYLILGGHLTWEHSFGEGYWSSEVPLFFGLQPGQALNLGSGLGVGYLKDFHLRQDRDYIDLLQPTWLPVFSLSAGWAF